MSQAPEERCICGHNKSLHGFGHPIIREPVPEKFAGQEMDGYGACCEKDCPCKHFAWLKDIGDDFSDKLDDIDQTEDSIAAFNRRVDRLVELVS